MRRGRRKEGRRGEEEEEEGEEEEEEVVVEEVVEEEEGGGGGGRRRDELAFYAVFTHKPMPLLCIAYSKSVQNGSRCSPLGGMEVTKARCSWEQG